MHKFFFHGAQVGLDKVQWFVKMGRRTGIVLISKGSQQWTGNYVSEVGGGTKERWEGAKVKKWK